MRLQAHGIEADLLPGWEGRISVRRARLPADASPAMTRTLHEPERTEPVVHLANFPLPEQRGDFGSGAVDLMGSGHVLVVLFEYGPESVGKALFRRQGMPHRLRPDMFSGSALQRTIPGQAGTQVFFTAAERPFCLYVVLGRHPQAGRLVPLVNRALAATRILHR